jgi:predicted outer membrane repeat protein
MRLTPSSWRHTLSRLGFRRKRSSGCRPAGHYRRLLAAEHLESRSMLAVLTVNADHDTTNHTPGNTQLTLREAIQVVNDGNLNSLVASELAQVNTTSDPLGQNDVIQFSFGGPEVIQLTAGELSLFNLNPVTIDGPGMDLLTIQAAANSRIFHVYGRTTTIDGVTLTGGNVNSAGGAILFDSFDLEGSLTVQHSRITGNDATENGGGIFASLDYQQSLKLADSIVHDNTSLDSGGGLAIVNDSYLPVSAEILRTTFTNNTAGQADQVDTGHLGNGGAIFLRAGSRFVSYQGEQNGSKTVIDGCTIIGNHAIDTDSFLANFFKHGSGGGIHAELEFSDYSEEEPGRVGARLDIRNTEVSGNTAEIDGGGLFLNAYRAQSQELSYRSFTLTNSVVTGNTSQRGGGIYTHIASSDNFDVIDSRISGNYAHTTEPFMPMPMIGIGGGIYTYLHAVGSSSTNHPRLTITGTTLDDNEAEYEGGGLFVCSKYVGDVSVSNSTISGNSTLDLVNGRGGGMFLIHFYLPGERVDTRLNNVTVTNNQSVKGGGIYSEDMDDVITQINNSIISGNRDFDPEVNPQDDENNIGGRLDVANSRYNLIGTSPHLLSLSGGAVTQQQLLNANNILTDAPGLNALAENGGPTPTHAIKPNSPARNAGNDSLAIEPFDLTSLDFDQRGFDRIVNGGSGPIRVDIGAFEYAPNADFDNDGDVDGRDFLTWQRGYGTPDALHPDGDANFDGLVDGIDLGIWQAQYGTSPNDVLASADFDGDGDVDGRDFLTWQRGYGLTNQTHNDNGDANFDGVVDGADLAVWQLQYGTFISPVLAINGDYDHDGHLDADDYLIWQMNSGLTSATQAQGDATGDGLVNGDDLLAWEIEYTAAHPNGYLIPSSSIYAVGGLSPGQILVSSLADDNDLDYSLGDLSLREALSIAAETPGADTIIFAPDLAGTIDLDSELTLATGFDSDITIEGPGADVISINAEANWLSHVFNVTNYAEIENFTIRNLRLTGSSSGAIHVEGAPNRHVTLDGVEISDNWGTGVWVEGGDLTVINSEIARNWVYGIDFNGYGNIVVEDSTIYDNEGIGVGIWNSTGKIINTTVSGNHTSDETGGVWVNGSTVLLTNVTITDNDGSMTGGLYSTRGGVATLHNSIVVGNTSGAAVSNVSLSSFWGNGTIGATSSYNLFGTVPSGSVPSGNGNQVGVSTASVGLAPLGAYGGTTPTHMLLTGSIALNAGSNGMALNASGQTLATDQRGMTRISGSSVDIGSVEGSSGLVLTVGTLIDENDSNHVSSDYSLREALDDASVYAGVETIQFAPSLAGVLTLTLGQLVVDSNLNLIGPGADQLTISGNDASRVFSVSSGVTAAMSDMRIADGYFAGSGGGISSAGNLTLNRVAIEDNYSYAGGGVYATGTLTVISSTIADNTGYYIGGGIYVNAASASLINATISSNTSSYGGGGLYSGSSTVTLAHSTVTQNRSTTSNAGGGIYVSSGNVVLSHTIVADNFYGSGSSESDVYGSLDTSLSRYNLIGTGGSGGLTGTNGNLVGISNPGLTELDFHGGTRRMHALLFGSLAVDGGDDDVEGEPELDGRDRARIDDGNYDGLGRIDIGAFELAADEYFGWLGG